MFIPFEEGQDADELFSKIEFAYRVSLHKNAGDCERYLYGTNCNIQF